jgi:hypothetical protein
MTTGLIASFAQYDAVLVNPRWSNSAVVLSTNEVVFSCWQHKLHYTPNMLTYIDRLSDWKGNKKGRNEYRNHIMHALAHNSTVRLVIAKATDPAQADNCTDSSTVKKIIYPKREALGRVALFDNDIYIFEFRRGAI